MEKNCFIYEVNQLFKDVFVSQDPELFDTVFEIEGKKLYADKLRLSIISPTFKIMISDRWNPNKNDAIKITSYSYENFKELLTFIYSGKCNITDTNVFTILDMSEFYRLHHLKKICDKYLSKIEINFDNVIHLIETSNKYSLVQMKEPIQLFISDNFTSFLKCNAFVKADESLFENFFEHTFHNVMQQKPEEAFQAIYEWTEQRAMKESGTSEKKLKDTIKSHLSPFLPHFPFMKMKHKFVKKYVVDKAFLFSPEKLNQILEFVNSYCSVTITNSYGQSISGNLPINSSAAQNIASLKDCESCYSGYDIIFWKTKFKIPSIPSQLKKTEEVDWYLVYLNAGQIGIGHYCVVNNSHYILAEMSNTKNFEVDQCKIKIE